MSAVKMPCTADSNQAAFKGRLRPAIHLCSSVFICGQFRDFILPSPAFSNQSQPTRSNSIAMNPILQRGEIYEMRTMTITRLAQATW